jgi:hypothetical protein
MPTISSISASIILSDSKIKLRELSPSYYDSAVCTHVPVPFKPPAKLVGSSHATPFEIRVRHKSTALWGFEKGIMLAVIGYIDGHFAGMKFMVAEERSVQFGGWTFMLDGKGALESFTLWPNRLTSVIQSLEMV